MGLWWTKKGRRPYTMLSAVVWWTVLSICCKLVSPPTMPTNSYARTCSTRPYPHPYPHPLAPPLAPAPVPAPVPHSSVCKSVMYNTYPFLRSAHLAATAGLTDCLELLKGYGAILSAVDVDGAMPLHGAAAHGHAGRQCDVTCMLWVWHECDCFH